MTISSNSIKYHKYLKENLLKNLTSKINCLTLYKTKLIKTSNRFRILIQIFNMKTHNLNMEMNHKFKNLYTNTKNSKSVTTKNQTKNFLGRIMMNKKKNMSEIITRNSKIINQRRKVITLKMKRIKITYQIHKFRNMNLTSYSQQMLHQLFNK